MTVSDNYLQESIENGITVNYHSHTDNCVCPGVWIKINSDRYAGSDWVDYVWWFKCSSCGRESGRIDTHSSPTDPKSGTPCGAKGICAKNSSYIDSFTINGKTYYP